MPDQYREAALKFIEMHANSEVMGALPEREWIPRAPSLRRKLSLTAKVQDEVGHAQILYRIAEDLGKSREAMFEDLINGRTKFHNVFHYPTESWGDVAVAAACRDIGTVIGRLRIYRTNCQICRSGMFQAGMPVFRMPLRMW